MASFMDRWKQLKSDVGSGVKGIKTGVTLRNYGSEADRLAAYQGAGIGNAADYISRTDATKTKLKEDRQKSKEDKKILLWVGSEGRPGGSGRAGSKLVAAVDDVSLSPGDIQKAQSLLKKAGYKNQSKIQKLADKKGDAGVARSGRKDGESKVWVGRVNMGGDAADASLINTYLKSLAAKKDTGTDTTTTDTTTTTTGTGDTTLVGDLGTGSDEVNTAYDDVVDTAASTFGTGTDVDQTVQKESSFTDADGNPVSMGAAEDRAIEAMETGRKSTILTSALGLIDDEDDEETLTKKKTLIGV